MGIDHLEIEIKPPYFESYVVGIQNLKKRYGTEFVITGDIDQIENKSNWIEDCCLETSIKPVFPLWKLDRKTIAQELLNYEIQVVISYVNHPSLPKHWRGLHMNEVIIKELFLLQKKYGIDPMGENGEYHTMAFDAPMFKKSLTTAEMIFQ